MAISSNTTCTLIARNLPKDVSKNDVESVFEDIGPVKKCLISSSKDVTGEATGICYITFAVREDAEAALKQPVEINGKKLSLELCGKRKKEYHNDTADVGAGRNSRSKNVEIEEKRIRKEKWRKKKPRLIIRNLSFQVSEGDLKKEFSEFGELSEVKIPLNTDGKKRGFAFVQFKDTKCAIKAIKSLNLKNIKGRPVAVDFALPKDKYESTHLSKSKDHDVEEVDEVSHSDEHYSGSSNDEEEDDSCEIQQKRFVENVNNDDNSSESESSDNEDLNSNQQEDVVKDGENSRWFDLSDDDDDTNSSSSFNSNGEESDLNDSNASEHDENQLKTKVFKRKNHQCDEKTLFIRNLPFMTDEESFKECMEQFGDVSYALLCLDPQTEHPKGTGFVRFKSIESAKSCLNAADEKSEEGLILDGRRIYAQIALSRDDVNEKIKNKNNKKESKDKRNLFLAREGLIREGSLAAKDVSKADMAKRIQLELKKKQMLRNLHFFVSKTRLVIHNLPPDIDDKQLRILFKKATGTEKCKITEARVMRNLKQVDTNGNSPSKGFGFVTFTEHEHALSALRNLNNNPNVFSMKKRPIVEFSIENKSVLNAKNRKLESRKSNAGKSDGGSLSKEEPPLKKRTPPESLNTSVENESFTGFISKKDIKSLPTHVGPKIRTRKNKTGPGTMKKNIQSKVLPVNGKKSKVKSKKPKTKNQMIELKDEKSFQTLVNKYKKTMVTGTKTSRGKWFEDDE